MGIFRSGLLGPFSKKTGAVVGRRRRGQNVMTGLHDISKKAPTQSQLEERLKFGMLNSFLTKIKSLVNIGFKRYVNVKTAVNVAYSYNAEHAFVKVDEQWQINFPAIVYSRGPIDMSEGATAVLTSNGEDPAIPAVLFSWLAQKQSACCQYTDMASFLIYNVSEDKAMKALNAVNRYGLSYRFELPVSYIGDTIHCYMNFNAADGKKVGDSLYLGQLVIG